MIHCLPPGTFVLQERRPTAIHLPLACLPLDYGFPLPHPARLLLDTAPAAGPLPPAHTTSTGTACYIPTHLPVQETPHTHWPFTLIPHHQPHTPHAAMHFLHTMHTGSLHTGRRLTYVQLPIRTYKHHALLYNTTTLRTHPPHLLLP